MFGVIYLWKILPGKRAEHREIMKRVLQVERTRAPEVLLNLTLGPGDDGSCAEIQLYADAKAADDFPARAAREEAELKRLWDALSPLCDPESWRTIRFEGNEFLHESFVREKVNLLAGRTEMNFFEEVQIITDNNMAMFKMAQSIRFQLEAYAFVVRFNQLFHWTEVDRFLEAQHSCRHLVICTHGIPVKDQYGFRFECFRRGDKGFGAANYDITATVLKGKLRGYSTVVSIACASGKQEIADALFDSGVSNFVAPVEPAAMPASAAFVGQLFYYLLYYGKNRSEQDLLQYAVARSTGIDEPGRPGGTHFYKLFSRAQAPGQ